jgi:hypothetical protein
LSFVAVAVAGVMEGCSVVEGLALVVVVIVAVRSVVVSSIVAVVGTMLFGQKHPPFGPLIVVVLVEVLVFLSSSSITVDDTDQ